MVTVYGEDEWRRLCVVPGLTGLRNDTFSSAQKRTMHRDEIDTIISTWTSDHTPQQVIDQLQEAGVAAGVVQHAPDLVEDEQLAFRHFFVSLDHPVLGAIRADRSALLLEGLGLKEWKAAPSPGEDNDYVLGRLLGFSEQQIRLYEEKGII